MNQNGVIANILILIILGVGIVAGLYLIQHPQIFKPKAGGESLIIQALEMKDSEGNVVDCDSSTNPPTCTTSSQDVTIKIKDLDALIQKQ